MPGVMLLPVGQWCMRPSAILVEVAPWGIAGGINLFARACQSTHSRPGPEGRKRVMLGRALMVYRILY